jgi:hypothetical protein
VDRAAVPLTFDHRHASHCESGVMSSLLRHHGMPVSEAMAFGITSALAFAYLPFLRINGLPLIAYRMPPGAIIRGLDRALGLGVKFEKFRSPLAGAARLDELVDSGRLVGLQTSIYWLPYVPQGLRFHFNAHNLLVYGRDRDEYLVSDPVVETVVRCPRADMERARFAKGVLAPKGRLYYSTRPPTAPDWAALGKKALRRTANIMLRTPAPLIGVRGIRWLARSVGRLPVDESAKLYIGHIVRMQEEIGTGGAGFRFMYAAFLQELSSLNPALGELATRMVAIGDRWQEFAIATSRMIKRRDPLHPPGLATHLRAIAQEEETFYRDLERAAAAWRA